jgi:predicted NAD-dependent protein-ADP-ribosyltransferase YbiA (DUF1768 family)
MSVYDSAIINSYGEITELTKHIDNTEDKGFAYKIPIVSISLIGDSLFNYSKPSNDPTHYLPDKEQIKLKPGQVVVFGGPSRAMAHRVTNGESGNSINIKNSVNSLKTERINIPLRRALPLSEEEYNNWVNSNKSLSTQQSETQTRINIKPIVKDLSRWSDIKNATTPYTNKGIVVTRISGTKEHFGNPFIGSKRRDNNGNLIESKVDNITIFNTIDEADQAYRDWLEGIKYQNVEPLRREWILKQINEGKLDGKILLYYKPMEVINNNGTIVKGGYHSHADSLSEIVEKLRINQPTTQTEINIYASTGENAELSNFAIRPFTTNVETSSGNKQYTFQSVEQGFHFYKAVIANNPQIAAQILKTTNGGTLRNLTNRNNLKLTPEQVIEWDNTSKSIMLNLMYDSYVQNPQAAQKLLATGNAIITHKVREIEQDNGRFSEVVMTVRDMLKEEMNEMQSLITFEEEPSSGYRERTIKNASADATIAIAVDFNSAGELLTKKSVLGQGKKYISIDANTLTVTQERVDKIVEQLNSVNAKTLNIAGNGIYTMKGKYTQQQVDDFTYDLLNQVVNSPNLKTKIESIRSGGQTGFDEAGAKAGIKLGLPTLVLAPKGWIFRNINRQDISNEQEFKARFKNVIVEPSKSLTWDSLSEDNKLSMTKAGISSEEFNSMTEKEKEMAIECYGIKK